MAARSAPPSASFAFEMAVRSLDDQLRRIEALDTKAGILIATNGVLSGLLFAPRSPSLSIAPWVGVPVMVTLLLSSLLALLSFASRRYEFAPKPEALIRLADAREEWLKWRSVGSLLDAIKANRDKLAWKSRLLTGGLCGLIATITLVGGYSLQRLITGI